MTFKQKVVTHFDDFIGHKIETLRQMISDLSEDAKNDAKGSAGDKHETALSMMHLEQEKLNQKIKEFIELKIIFSSIDFQNPKTKIGLGSLVLANETYFLISVGLQKVILDNQTVFAISPQAPLAEKLIGKTENELITMNGMEYLIKSIS